MANSTFSGPVRSQNGFQELVNGVWTPVGSGGGGGGGSIPTIFVPYSNASTLITLPVGTTAGQQVNIVSGLQFGEFWPSSIGVTANIAPEADGLIVWPTTISYAGVNSINPGSPGGATVSIPSNVVQFNATAYYLGIIPLGGTDYAGWSVNFIFTNFNP